jgi:ligand-binding SRPBCC domain-containing protein
MRDRVTYALPSGFLGKMAYPVVRCDVEKIFDFRTQTMPRLFPP